MNSEPVSSGVKILVVDDDDSIRQTMGDLLRMERHDVVTAPDGESAIDLIRSGDIDILVTDLGLPGISGWELARLSRMYQESISIMAITSWQGTESEQRIKAYGIDAIVWKPFRFKQITDTIEQIISKRQ